MSPATTLSRITAVLAGRRRDRKAAPVHGRPRLEALEDRIVPVVIDSGHTDVAVGYSANAGWALTVHLDEGDITYDPSEALLYAGPNTHTTQPNDPRFAFLGAGAGGDVWVMPQTADPSKIYLGFGLDDVEPGTFDNYFETDPRVNAQGEWIKVSVIDVRGPGQFSMWQTDASGNPIVWASTYDPNSQENAIFLLPGGDSHLNWGFTATGTYEVDFQASAYLNGELTSSDVVTYHFGVEDTGGFVAGRPAMAQGGSPSPGNAAALTPSGQAAGSMSALTATPSPAALSTTTAAQGGDLPVDFGSSALLPSGQAAASPLAPSATPKPEALPAPTAALDQLFGSTGVDHAQDAPLLSSGQAAASPLTPSATPKPETLPAPTAALDQLFGSTGVDHAQDAPQLSQAALLQAPLETGGVLGGDLTMDFDSVPLGGPQPDRT